MQTPSQTTLNELIWSLSNGEKVIPTKQNIVIQSITGDSGIVVFTIPNTTYKWYNYVFLTKKHAVWIINGCMDSSINGDFSSNKRGINLPLNKFLEAEFHINGSQEAWVFENSRKTIVIDRQKEHPVSLQDFKTIKINGMDASEQTRGNVNIIFYDDEGYMVTVVGNVKLGDILDLAKSLPATLSADFPFNK